VRETERMLAPSTSRARTSARASRLRRFMGWNVCLGGQAVNGDI
jgi:hypothetical protein